MARTKFAKTTGDGGRVNQRISVATCNEIDRKCCPRPLSVIGGLEQSICESRSALGEGTMNGRISPSAPHAASPSGVRSVVVEIGASGDDVLAE